MRALFGITYVFGLVITVVSPTSAQRLPTGEYHANRERTFDLRHYRAQIQFNFDYREILGHATLDLTLLRSMSSITLDSIGIDVSSVELTRPRSEALEFVVRDNTLVVDLGRERAQGESLEISIRYSAEPQAGMYFQPDDRRSGQYFVTTYGEGGLHANWLPIYGDVNDKFTSEMIVTVPVSYVVVSNGRLVEKKESTGNQVTYHWLQEKPHPNYLVALYVGEFERGDLEPAFEEIPLSYWVPRGRLAEGAYAFRNTARMVEYYSELFDYRYPWAKYDQIAVKDYPVGAMEHTGVTGHNASVLRNPRGAPVDFGGPRFDEYSTDWSAEATISHELAHHWFGNNLTCRNLSYLWLNESFASYLMMLWDEESVSRDQLIFDVDLARRHYFGYVDTEHIIRPLEHHNFDDTNTIYNEEHTYLKGAAVLHMLRAVLGDDEFFSALSYYLHKHEFSNVDSQDLKIAIEESTGRNLDWFWSDWVTGGGHPQFEVSYRYLEDRQQIDLEVRQVQPIIEGQNLFKLPAEITIATPSGTRTETVWLETAEQKFLLDATEEPLLVSFDGAGHLVAEIRFDKELEELLYQSKNDSLAGRLRALRQLAARFATREAALEAFEASLEADRFWGERAEAARLLGTVRTPRAEELATAALEADDYRIRKAAVLALGEMGTRTAVHRLAKLVREETHSDVAGTAIVALADVAPETPTSFFTAQLERDSWYDEIKIATLQAMTKLERPELVPIARQFTDSKWNQDVRRAAIEAWKATQPTDPDLHRMLADMATSPPYALQTYAVELLGELYVTTAIPYLTELEERDIDDNLTVLARDTLAEIKRVAPAAAQKDDG